MKTQAMLLALTVSLLAVPVQADDAGAPDGNGEDPCPAIQLTPWPPYVFVAPECIGDGSDQPPPTAP